MDNGGTRLEAASTMTIVEAIASSLQRAREYNRSVLKPPAAVLWPDEGRQWEPLLPLLRAQDPTLLTLGDYAPETRTGPAIWIRCLLARELEAASWSESAVPIVYLPGFSRQLLRGVESCPRSLQPLAELQYRGAYWSQTNARDWTVLAFLKSKEGLNLDVAQDKATLEAMKRALTVLAQTPVAQLRGRRLEAADFDQLLTPDPARDLLRWMGDPQGTRAQWSSEQWEAFRAICKAGYAFDPHTDGELTAAERLIVRQGGWKQVWQRYAEAPKSFPGLYELLMKVQPPTLLFEPSVSPLRNIQDEAALRSALFDLADRPKQAVKGLLELEAQHGQRRGWVWSQLGMAPLAGALEHLATMAKVCGEALGGSTPEEMGAHYVQGAWRADAAMLAALASVQRGEDLTAVRAIIATVYAPWLSDGAERLQTLVGTHGYPGTSTASKKPTVVPAGCCLLFADGLRFDIGQRLATALEARGLVLTRTSQWSALPTVTPTCKPAVSPIAHRVVGLPHHENFQPADVDDKPLTTDRFRKLLQETGFQVLAAGELGDPSGRGWLEHGDLDHMGHEEGWKLARRVDEQVRELVERIEGLLEHGWTTIQVITDHGWVLLPDGLPKAELPKYLAETRWGRCAVLKISASAAEHLIVDWHWSSSVRIALAPGVRCFKAGTQYTHGGLSLQECLTPVLTIQRGQGDAQAELGEVSWRGLRCRVHVDSSAKGLEVDIRTKPADPSSSVALDGGKTLDEAGNASVLVPNDELMGTAAFVVVVDAAGSVLAKQTTCIGE